MPSLLGGLKRNPWLKVHAVVTMPTDAVLGRYEAEHKAMLPVGDVPEGCEIVEADFWLREIARHDRWRLAYAVWSVLARKLL